MEHNEAAMLTPTKDQKTYADYAALDEGAPYQLIDGELVMSPAPTVLHQLVVWRLGTHLFNFVEKHDLGLVVGAPVDVYFSETETYQPDLVFISKERLNIVTEQKVMGAPDLVVEVLSPGTGYYDLTKKRRVYQASGVKEYWIVDPTEKTVEVLTNVGDVFEGIEHASPPTSVQSRLLDGFEVELATLFAF